MKKLTTIIFTVLPFLTFYSQVGINTNAPKSTLHILANENPNHKDGIIIPRVTSLNTTDTKENGLLVFLESDNAQERGFYYWSNPSWLPFVSSNKLQENRSALIFRGLPTLNGGNFSLITTGSSIRTYGFETDNHLSNNGNFAYVNNGSITITKAGHYDVSAALTLQVNASGRSRRDSYEISLRRNNNLTTIQSSYGFPNSGTTYTMTNSITLTGAIQLAVGDILDIHINRFHTPETINGDSGSQITSVIPELSNLTLRYIAD